MMPRRRLLRAGLMVASLAMLAGCASVTPRTPDFAAQGGDGTAASEYHGRFSARKQRNGSEEGVHGNFVWAEHGGNVQLSLLSPLGQTLAIVTATAGSATLELPNQAPRTAPEVDSLMQQALGFSLPVSGMRDWLRARPTRGHAARIERDPNGRLTQLEQDGWTVTYLDYRDTPTGSPPRVRRLDLARTLDGEPLTVRLVIDE